MSSSVTPPTPGSACALDCWEFTVPAGTAAWSTPIWLTRSLTALT
ncbi:MAG: hypothetical protein ACR2K2_13810 [Mycobacteriales bacterium]